LLQAQRELLARELPLVEGQLGALRDAIATRQKAEAEQARTEAERAEREALGKHPTIRRVIEKNATLSEELAATLDCFGQTQAASKAVEAQAKQIKKISRAHGKRSRSRASARRSGRSCASNGASFRIRAVISRTPRTGKRRSPAWACASCS
jgi:small-conductance mechanosensitive channel